MATQVQQTDDIQVRVKLTDPNEPEQYTTRTLTVTDTSTASTVDLLESMRSLRTELTTGSLSGVVQAASFRDDDVTQEPWDTTDVEFVRVQTTKTIYDLDNP